MEQFKSWEEMTALEQAQCTYWDMYKDAYGHRPRGVDTSTWTLEDFEAEFKLLGTIIEQENTTRKEAEAEAIVKFEQHVMNTICMGARDRETALKWIMDASTANGDWEYLCYDLGLPYSYFKKAA
jgi:molybdenum cofactor biosynthesis enzyme